MVFDLVVMVRNRIAEIRKRELYHPADVNAFVNGVLSGLNMAEVFIQAGRQIDGDIVDAASDVETKLSDALNLVNSFLPVGSIVKADMFVLVSYRTSAHRGFYRTGIRLGTRYVDDLLYSFAKMSSMNKAIVDARYHLVHVRRELEEVC